MRYPIALTVAFCRQRFAINGDCLMGFPLDVEKLNNYAALITIVIQQSREILSKLKAHAIFVRRPAVKNKDETRASA